MPVAPFCRSERTSELVARVCLIATFPATCMAQLFPQWINRFPAYLALAAVAAAVGTPLGVWYFLSPSFTDVGYQPEQPIPFSHRLHVGELEVDCRYCHQSVELSAVASLPSSQTCLNCHRLLGRSVAALEPLFESEDLDVPLRWTRVHKTPEYTYFDHSLHLAGGIGCVSCHGDLAAMDRVSQTEPLSMSWCLRCHRHPEEQLRPRGRLTDARALDQQARVELAAQAQQPTPPLDCTGCHR